MCDGTTVAFLCVFACLVARGLMKVGAKVDNEGTIHKAVKDGIVSFITKRLK